jgi:thiamine-monophosphate kinase
VSDETVGQLGERALVRRLRDRIPAGDGVVVGVGDDAAAVESGALTLVTTDALVEGVHFRRDWGPASLLGRKALSINLSDIAAMAGSARYATVSLCLPADLPVAWLDELYDGLLERAAEVGVSLVGGNVSATPGPLSIDVTLIGQGDRLLRRAGAMAGDLVVVTGVLGGAAAGLKFLQEGARIGPDGEAESLGPASPDAASSLASCIRAQLDPTPPLAFARALAEHDLVHAAVDLSDGLSGDLLALCEESNVSALLDASTMPLDPCVQRLEREGGPDPFTAALHGGEDYQLLLAVPKDALDGLKDVAVVWDVPLTVVGEFTEGAPQVSMRFGDKTKKVRPKSHEHFRDASRAEAAAE